MHKNLEGLEILGVWGNLPDISVYFEIFDDYLDFKILPWDPQGYDDGQMIPERKNALRLLLTGIQEYNAANQKPTQQQPDRMDEIYGKVVESEGTVMIKGKAMKTTGRQVVMKAPEKEDLEDWNWKKFAYPDDIIAYEKLKKEGRV